MNTCKNIIQYSEHAAKIVADHLKNNCTVIMPTDTVYGLCCCYGNDYAAANINAIKRRDNDKHLAILIQDYAQIADDIIMTKSLEMCLKLLPCAITIIAKRRGDNNIDAGTIGFRIPNSAIVSDILAQLGKPICATSVNYSGAEAAISVEQIDEEIVSKVDLILDCGPTEHKMHSTIVDCTRDEMLLIREGAYKFASDR